jgi:hypothetical protein
MLQIITLLIWKCRLMLLLRLCVVLLAYICSTYRRHPVMGRCRSSFSDSPMRPTHARIHAIMSSNMMAITRNGNITTVNIAV